MFFSISLLLALVSPAQAEWGKQQCKQALKRIDPLYVSGDRAAAWELAERMSTECREVELRRPREADRLWRSYSGCRDSGRLDECIELGERGLLFWLATAPESVDTAVSMNNLALLYSAIGDYQAALPFSQRAFFIAEAALGPHNPSIVGPLSNLALLYSDMGDYEAALPLYQRALAIEEAAFGLDDPATASSLRTLAHLYRLMGDYGGAQALVQRDLAIQEAAFGPDHLNTAVPLAKVAILYAEMGDYKAALPLSQRALVIQEAALGPDHPDIAASLNTLAVLYRRMGDYEAALPLLERALAIDEGALGPHHPSTGNSLNNLAALYRKMGDYGAALPLSVRALAIVEAAFGPDHPRTAHLLSNLAAAYSEMGNYQAALPLYQRALSILEAAHGPDHPDTAASLNYLAILYTEMGDYEAALPLSQRALAIREAALGTNHPATASSLHHLALLYSDMGDYEAALPLSLRAVGIHEAVLGPDHPATATSLNNLARLHRSMGGPSSAAPLQHRATLIALDTLDASTRWSVYSGAALQATTTGDLTEAVLWGKLSVQTLEHTRQGLEQLDGDQASSFADSHQSTYRSLADNLVSLGRIPEAEAVLALLKVDEQHRFQQRSGGGSATLAFTPTEAIWVQRFEDSRQTVIADARELAALRKASGRGTLPPERQARLEELAANQDAAKLAIDATLTELHAELADANRAATFAEMGTERLEKTQSRLGPGTVLLHAVVLPEHILLILTTPHGQVAERVSVSQEKLHETIAAFRQALTDPSQDPRPAGEQLYGWLIAPFEADLAAAEAQTVLTYLDGSLRYIPMSALYDGEQFVAEKWATVVYTSASETDLLRVPSDDPWVAAFGASKAATVQDQSFSALTGVPGELDAVVREGEGDEGAVEGRSYLDEAFTAQALSESLTNETPWIHIASHFQFTPGATEVNSFLLLGDGSGLTLRQLRLGNFSMVNVDLLALSACETAMGESKRADGSEVEGLAVIAQNRGAGAVLATLWKVDDASTAAWMAGLYSGEPGPTSERVRSVQLQFLAEEITAQEPEGVRSSAMGVPVSAGTVEGLEGWRHPYYWAPFVLYGTGG